MEYLIDTHCHLNFKAFSDDAEEAISRAKEANVRGMIVVGTDLATSKKAIDLANKHEGLWATVGYHPIHVGRLEEDKDTLKTLVTLADENKVVAIGEIGLDYYREPFDKDAQKEFLGEMLSIAKEKNKAIILHSRQALNDLYEKITKSGASRGVLHCFPGNLEDAKRFLDLGFYLGFNGLITYSGDEENREVAKLMPLERLLLETDSPYLTPVPKRGERNEPANVNHVAKEIAKLRDIGIEEVVEATSKNARALFGI